MKQFLIKYKIILFGLFILIDVILVMLFAVNSKKQPQKTPVPSNTSTNQNLKYQPIINSSNFQNNGEETIINEIKKIYFPSNSPNRKNEAWYQDNNLIFIKEIVTLKDSIRVTDLINKYGQPTLTLYGGDALSGFYLYATPEIGIAYIANTNSGLILEIWQFEPTSIELFSNKYADGYETKLPIRQ